MVRDNPATKFFQSFSAGSPSNTQKLTMKTPLGHLTPVNLLMYMAGVINLLLSRYALNQVGVNKIRLSSTKFVPYNSGQNLPSILFHICL